MASTPAYASTPRIGMAQVSTANTNRNGTGTIADVLTGVAAGTRIERVVVEGTGTTTAGMVRLYLYDGTNTRLYREVSVTAITPSASVQVFRSEFALTDCVLPSASWKLQASTHNAETFNLFAFGADLT